MATSSPNGTPNGTVNPADFGRFADQMHEQWEKSMGAWWDQVLESQPFLDAVNKGMSSQVRARGQYESAMDEQLKKLHMPTRGDLVHVARIATLLEEKLLQVEDTLLTLKDTTVAQVSLLERIEREALQARIEAAEARIELREKLGALQARIDALDSAAEAAPAVGAPAAGAPAAADLNRAKKPKV